MFNNLTFNSVMWILIGVGLFAASIVEVRMMRIYAMAIGMIFLGIGCILCGITNGFTLYTPAGHLMRKAGVLSFLIGIIPTAYYVYIYFLS